MSDKEAPPPAADAVPSTAAADTPVDPAAAASGTAPPPPARGKSKFDYATLPPPNKVKKVKKPDEAKFQSQQDALNVAINAKKAELRKHNNTLRFNDRDKTRLGERIATVQAELAHERTLIPALQRAEHETGTELEKARQAQQSVTNALRAFIKHNKYSTIPEIDAAIRVLEGTVQNASNLREEKAILQEISALQHSKGNLGQREQLQTQVEQAKAIVGHHLVAHRATEGELKKKQARVARLEEDIKVMQANANNQTITLTAKEQEASAAVTVLEKELKDLQAQLKELQDNYFQGLRDHKESENLLFHAKKAQEFREREKTREEIRKRNEDAQKELANAVPWLAEKIFFQSLVTYLTKFLPEKPHEPTVTETTSTQPAPPAQAVTANGQEAVLLVRGVDDVFGSTPSNNRRGGGKRQHAHHTPVVPSTLKHDLETMRQFSSVDIELPLTVDGVPRAIEIIKSKLTVLETLPVADPCPFRLPVFRQDHRPPRGGRGAASADHAHTGDTHTTDMHVAPAGPASTGFGRGRGRGNAPAAAAAAAVVGFSDESGVYE
eukprot:gnl/Spiro4/8033_TR4229_c1_g2_i1.p2 gnl/Spiro4/8033_TR4229_c1_g2~~gnl/Spiro4/8033_TR4229_c1_g2_i1.p2  ORF type:complete len:581 (+),score=152.67 gnl/Spiro4/8033_TR4229_c1_g2_i1:85-1743(+)